MSSYLWIHKSKLKWDEQACLGETDWKVMAIDVNDPLAENLNDIQDVDKIMPGFLKVNIHHIEVTLEKLL